ncbi:streptogramin lyase [Paenibacillus endophyticus]|uniref:Streptogramin lyase n=1 Tax=Paenibacillus endophyticus TaxID=1294268 RepID=A0A7W5C342_9BACL|nr:YIP1 family protein [Paenibacillus endophyticus]MBB3150346.1 streptogramin lyase [Paenibacillus endophyticus]
MKRFLLFLLLAATCMLAAPEAIYAELPYRTSYYDSNQAAWLRIQPVYAPAETKGPRFSEPVDLQVGADDKVYVADKGANKIAVLSPEGELLLSIGAEEGESMLSAPEGLFVTPEGLIYVADSGNQRIAVFGADGKFVRDYKKPASTFLEQEHFVPVKLVVDRRGVMYISLNSSYQGLLRMNGEGEFMGYFGANKAQQTVLNWLKKLILNKEQLAKELASLPRPISNVALDSDGFIFTATAAGFGQGAIRKLNAGGVDAFKNKTLVNGHGIVDVASDSNGFLYNVDMDSGRVNIYDQNAEALFAFGFIDNETQQYGVLGYPTSIGVDSKFGVWISDSRTGTIHKFVRTEFGSDVMQALTLYLAGKYEQSEPYWDRVYARNDMYNGVFQGLGKVYLHDNNHEAALSFLKTAFDTKGYSKAFWEIRLDYLQKHLIGLAAAIAAVLLLLKYGVKAIRKQFKRRPLPESWQRPLADIRNLWFVMLHPYQGFYKLKEAKVSAWIIAFILAAVIAVKVGTIYLTGFLFHPVELSQINIWGSLGLFVVPWLTWIIANYLVCSVKDGEGKFREVIQGSTYALAPYLFFSIPALILSNLVTLDERVIVDSLNTVMFLWMGVMLIVMTQVIHNFDFLETLKNIAITVFTIGTIWLFAFLVFGLSYNLYDFFYQLYKEVTFYG